MFLSYADNRHTRTDTHTHTHTHTHGHSDRRTRRLTDTRTYRHADPYTLRPNAKNVIFGFRGASERVNPSKSLLQKFDPKAILSLLIGKRK